MEPDIGRKCVEPTERKPGWQFERHVRVFVSSTFLDFIEERDVLAKRVFPRLAAWCEERGVTLDEVDLRWGITDEEKAEGRVLSVCLEEISRSRPFFVGLLGERFGWVPDPPSPALLKQEPWLGEMAGERAFDAGQTLRARRPAPGGHGRPGDGQVGPAGSVGAPQR